MKYLHEDAPGVYHLDHRLIPEVSAMFCAMSSRMPSGGIRARYAEIVEAVAEGLWEDAVEESKKPNPHENRRVLAPWEKAIKQPDIYGIQGVRDRAEDRLCTYPIHLKVQGFFDKFVLNYGHSSILELTGQPSISTERISWYSAFLLFDSPLCSGQEFSTRAVRHKDWPMARECYETVMYGVGEPEHVGTMPPRQEFKIGEPLPEKWANIEMKDVDVPHPLLKELHDEWFEVFEAEVDAWKDHLSDPAVRAALGIKDKEPFRPALDRARWAIPGTIATGCCHTGHLRERARILRDGLLLAQRSKAPAAVEVWENIRKGYAAALPGLAGMGLREAVYDESSRIPAHLFVNEVPPADEVQVKLHMHRETLPKNLARRPVGERSYLDPVFNQIGAVDIAFQCSLAVSRDWHRHRTMYPWSLDVVRGKHADITRSAQEKTGLFFDDGIRIHPAYEPKSALARERLPALLEKSTHAYDEFMKAGDQMRAMLCLPLGTLVQMSGQAGLRDAVYTLELRSGAVGANFEYKAQATKAIELLVDQLAAAQAGLPAHMGLQ